MLGREHPRANRLVHAFDLRQVHAAARVADEHRARHLELRHRLPAARGNRARAGSDDFAAFEQRLDLRVMLDLLERFERLEARIFIVEPDDEARRTRGRCRGDR